MSDINSRASASIIRRVCGSFGFRAVASLQEGFDPSLNLGVCKALGMSKDEISNSVDLYVDGLKPKVDRDSFLENMGDLDNAEEQYDAIMAQYDTAVSNQADIVKKLTAAFDDAEPAVELDDNAAQNLTRVTNNALSQAQADFIKTGNVEWVNAVKQARATVHDTFGLPS